MQYTQDDFLKLFQSKFNLANWQTFLRNYFHAQHLRIEPEALLEDNDNYEGFFLGSTTTKDKYELGFFFYKMEDGSVLRRKVGLRNLISPYLRYGFDAALAVFDDGKNWRLSLICDIKGEATNTKRFTYVFGEETAFYKTPVGRFKALQKYADEMQRIKEAFSVEALSDDFFDEYRKQYAGFVRFLTGKEYVKKNNKWVEQQVQEPDEQFYTSFGSNDKLVRDYIKKMMGRIVFLYFLQSKGWLAGNQRYMHDLFYNSEVKDDFLDKVLEPMFFGLLNTKPEDRSTAPLVNGVGVKYIPNADCIPYLNGGLFQQEKIDEVDSCFPAMMFQTLFDFFDSYNFTVDENDPDDAEVGVDPEMLGKIFENLLEDNKDKGAFYTPKEIVRYMCQESLTAYLQTGIEEEDTKARIANFVKTHNVEVLGDATSGLALSIDQKLKDVKICDPAIGSGAFPMGLLRELYECRKAIEVFAHDNAAEIKRHIIQNNIYGVDIEKGAVDIARLRFWLALIIDEKEPMPLPNLDFKIMQGDSLLENFMGVDLNLTSEEVKTGKDTKKTRGVLSFSFEETNVQKTIQDLVKSYFSITDHTLRNERRKQIDSYVKDYIRICAEGNKTVQDAVNNLEIPNDRFFLWHVYFKDVFAKGGFDIVIGNPPYIQLQSDSGKLATLYERCNYNTFARKGDIYCLFYERGHQILKSSGHLCYITSNKWMRAGYGEKTRGFLANNTDPKILIDFAGVKIFENATVDANILLFAKAANEHKTLCVKTNKQDKDCINNLSLYVQQNASECEFHGSDSWVILSAIEQSIKHKIEAVGTPLKDWDIQINYGIKTGCNDAFIISTEKRDEILANCQTEDERKRTAELIRPILRGRDIKRYGYDWAGLYLIATFPSRHYDIEQYPAVKNYLLSFGIERLEQTGKVHNVNGEKIKSRKKTNNKWFETQDSISYWEDFFKPKILWKRVGSILRFCYNDNEILGLDSTCFATGENIEFICCILNSPMGHYLLKDAPKTGTGDLLVSVQAIEPIQIPQIGSETNLIFKRLVEGLIKGDSPINEKEISRKVFKLYDLSLDEQSYIEENFT